MKKILVHLHLFYKDMWPEFKAYIRNISGYNYDLFVTMVDEDIAVQNDIIEFNPHAKIIFCENRGYDVRPFVQIMQSVDLNEYSYVVKLHTKRDLKGMIFFNGCLLQGNAWRKASCFFLKSRRVFSKVIGYLETNVQVGMCGSYWLTLKKRCDGDIEAWRKYDEIIHRYNLAELQHSFVAGTIFIARADIFSLLDYVDVNAFELKKARSGFCGEYAHAVERFFGYCVVAQGMTIEDPLYTNVELYKIRCRYYWHKIRRFFYLHERNKSGKMRLKICRIPLPIHLFTKEK